MADMEKKEVSSENKSEVSSNIENEQESISFENGQLSYIGRDCDEIPSFLGDEYGPNTTRLDLSFNLLQSLDGLEAFSKLEELIIDNNELTSSQIKLPQCATLHTLSLNKNKIKDVEPLLDQISKNMPNLTYLSLLGNIACPNQLSSHDKDEEDYQRYRHYVLYRLPNLKFLDSNSVTKTEAIEAKRVGPFLKIIKPSNETEPESTQDITSSDYSPLPESTKEAGDHLGTFGVNKYVYYGRHSEGNRFITNRDL